MLLIKEEQEETQYQTKEFGRQKEGRRERESKLETPYK
jgi:hypothetical protein